MIQKIEKVVRKHFTAKEEKLTARSEKKEDKKIKLINSNSELIFTLNLEKYAFHHLAISINMFSIKTIRLKPSQLTLINWKEESLPLKFIRLE